MPVLPMNQAYFPNVARRLPLARVVGKTRSSRPVPKEEDESTVLEKRTAVEFTSFAAEAVPVRGPWSAVEAWFQARCLVEIHARPLRLSPAAAVAEEPGESGRLVRGQRGLVLRVCHPVRLGNCWP